MNNVREHNVPEIQAAENDVFDIVNYFLSLSEPGTKFAITPLKLQKLLYYAQAWHIVETNRLLFNNEIQAWAHGPVVPEVYFRFRDYRFNDIDVPEAIELNIDDENTQQILNTVWEAYGQYDGKYLERLTHNEEPWINNYRPHLNKVIPPEEIARYYGDNRH